MIVVIALVDMACNSRHRESVPIDWAPAAVQQAVAQASTGRDLKSLGRDDSLGQGCFVATFEGTGDDRVVVISENGQIVRTYMAPAS